MLVRAYLGSYSFADTVLNALRERRRGYIEEEYRTRIANKKEGTDRLAGKFIYN